MDNITLDTDEIGIWLICETPHGPQQMGHVSWSEITERIQQKLLQEQFMIALIKMDEEDGLL